MSKQYKTIPSLMKAKMMGKISEQEFNEQLDRISNKIMHF